MENEPIGEEEVKLEELQEVELEKFDAQKYLGQVTKIAKVEMHKGEFGYYVKFITEPVEKLPGGVEITATKVVGLQKDIEGKWGWGKGTKMEAFLKKLKVSHPKEAIGKEVKVTTQMGKDGVDYLTI